MKFGIENLKKLGKVFFKLVNIGDKMGHENSWGERLGHLMGIFPSLMILSSVEWNLLDDEIKDLDDVEKVEFKEFCKVEFDIIDDKLEEFVESILDFSAYIGSVVSKTKDFISKVKLFFKK